MRTGRTARSAGIAALRGDSFFGFDSFEDLPEQSSVYGAGTFDLSKQPAEGMPANIELRGKS